MRPVIVPFFLSHQGCPHRCVFCDQSVMNGTSGVLPTPVEIRDTIYRYRASSRRHQVDVAFYGGTFTALPMKLQERLLSAVKPFIDAGSVGGVRISTRPDAVDDTEAVFLKSMGVTLVELGAQSFDEEVLIRSGRGYDSSVIGDACSTLKAHGLPVGIQLMPGLPGDTYEHSLRSFHQALALRPDCIRLYPTIVIAGTRLAELFRQGDYLPLSLVDALYMCKQMLLSALRDGVTVLRVGIQPTTDLVPGASIVAGPYHPAFRQLVESELCFDFLAQLMGDSISPGDATVTCSSQLISSVVGQHRDVVSRFQSKYGVAIAEVRQAVGYDRYDIKVDANGVSCRGNILKDLYYPDKREARDR